MFNIISNLSDLALKVIDKTGYAGIFLLSALESCAIPIPSEVVVPFSGFLASTGRFNLLAVGLVATVANLVGSIILFWIGRSGGRWVLERYGRYILVHQDDLDMTDRWFRRHGPATVFWSRILPGIRTFSALSAGIAEMSWSKFSLYTFLGSLPWNFTLAYIGYKTGKRWDILHPYFQKAEIGIVIVLVVFVIWYVRRHLKRRHV